MMYTGLSGNLSKSAVFEGVGHFERRFQTKEGVAHQPLCQQILEGLHFSHFLGTT